MAFLEICLDARFLKGFYNPLEFATQEANDYYSVGESYAPLVTLWKRQAYPKTYCRQVDADTVLLGYGNVQSQDDEEYLQIILCRNGSVRVSRDTHATLPLFYGYVRGALTISNNYSFVCKHTPSLTLSRLGVLETLLLNSDSRKLMWNEIHILGGLEQLDLRDGNLEVSSIAAREWIVSRDAPPADPHEFARRFSIHLDKFAEKLTQTTVAFETSGGLDSATLPLYLTKSHGRQYTQGLVAGALLFPGAFGVSQLEKLQSIAIYTGLNITQIPLAVGSHGMLQHVLLQQGEQEYFYCSQNPYLHAQATLLEVFSQLGTEVVITGIGGDDCLENVVDIPESLEWGAIAYERRKSKSYLSYFTSKAIEDYCILAPIKPYNMSPSLSSSAASVPIGCYNPYIELGMWPVSPFIDKGLYAFCQGLPAHFRANKNILRLFHQALYFPEAIYAGTQNEHFGVFFEQVFFSRPYEEVIYKYAQSSIAAHLGYIDPEALLRLYKDMKKKEHSGNQERGNILYHIYIWLCFEINAQLAQRRASSMAQVLQ